MNAPKTYEQRQQEHRPTDAQVFARAVQELRRSQPNLTPNDIAAALKITPFAADQLTRNADDRR